MSLGIALALCAAVAHAAWNIVVKQVSSDGVPALWAYTFGSVCVVVPVGVLMGAAAPGKLSWLLVGASFVSTLLHTAYAVMVQMAYKYGDVTVVYPVSRGTAPVLVALASLAVLGQLLTPWQWVGAMLMMLAVGLLMADSHPRELGGTPLAWGGAIAVMIASYTTFDGVAVVRWGVDPLAYYGLGTVMQLLVLTALIRGDVAAGLAQFRKHLPAVVALAVLIPTSYLLALYATWYIPVSVVAALRSSSLIWAALAACVLLGERMTLLRLAATGCTVAALWAMSS